MALKLFRMQKQVLRTVLQSKYCLFVPHVESTYLSTALHLPAAISLTCLLSTNRTSINAQKIVDERHSTHQPYQFWREERRTRGFDHFFVAHSSLKASPGGYHSSFKTVNYYIDEAEAKRDELLEKYDKTAEYWNEKKFGVQESELIALKQLNDTEKAT